MPEVDQQNDALALALVPDLGQHGLELSFEASAPRVVFDAVAPQVLRLLSVLRGATPGWERHSPKERPLLGLVLICGGNNIS